MRARSLYLGFGVPTRIRKKCVCPCVSIERAENRQKYSLFYSLSPSFRYVQNALFCSHGHARTWNILTPWKWRKPRCKDTPPATTIFAPFLIPVTTVSSWTICTDPYPTIARPEVRHFIPFQALPLIDLKFNVRVNKVCSLCVRQESLCHASCGCHFVPGYWTKVLREASGLWRWVSLAYA